MAKNALYNSLIMTRRWRKIRAQKMADNPLCEMCEKEGRITSATEVHHKIPVESTQDPARAEMLAYSLDNLMSLCRDCHHKIHTDMSKSPRARRHQLRDEWLAEFKKSFGIES